MVSFTVRMGFREEDRERVKDYLRKLGEASRKEPGCISFIPNLVEEGPASMLIYESYADDAALDSHRNSPHFRDYVANGIYKLITDRQLERLEAIV